MDLATQFRPLGPPRNRASELVERMTEAVLSGTLSPGTRLPTEMELVARFGVSRTVVREAFAVLRAEGLVEARQGSGMYVAADLRRRPFRIDPAGLQSIGEVMQVLELRITVETEAAGLAAARRGEADLARIGAALAAFETAIGRGESAIDEDYAFHCAVGDATGNRYFSSFLSFLGGLVIPRRSIVAQVEPGERRRYLARVLSEHRAIGRAVEAGDPAAARAAMRVHLRRSYDRYRRLAAADAA
ncbi:MAG TPA: FadR/GntR family transcriptional regulator [Beijerinckiaceae bacterium]|nr:FadR/GntR family transcriptional regulator [Beijerinckiaceae bacterium]